MELHLCLSESLATRACLPCRDSFEHRTIGALVSRAELQARQARRLREGGLSQVCLSQIFDQLCLCAVKLQVGGRLGARARHNAVSAV